MKDNSSAFDSVDYDGKVREVLPFYDCFHAQILDLIRALNIKNIRWLDTGCGTGSLAERALKENNDISFTLCEPSERMLNIAKAKLSDYKNTEFRKISSQQLDYCEKFDIVTAVQSHHYLDREEREKAVKNCFKALKSGGIFITFENIDMTSDKSTKIGIKRWESYMLFHGKTPEETKNHLARRGTELFPITIEEHLKLLREIGFESADVLWASYMQAGFFGFKAT